MKTDQRVSDTLQDQPVPPVRPSDGTGAPLTISVLGQPATQGSKQARPIYKGRGVDKVFTGRVAQVESSKDKHKTWREAVKAAAIGAAGGRPRIEETPVRIAVVFCFDKPASAPKRRRTWPIKRSSGDIDKLQRAAFDALCDAGVFKDDSQVVRVDAQKVYTDDPIAPLRTPGMVLQVWPEAIIEVWPEAIA